MGRPLELKGEFMGEIVQNKKTGQYYETHPYKCKVCGRGNIEHEYSICPFCGWEDDNIQNDDPNFMGGANHMSLNQYKKFWEENKEEIMNADNTCFKAIDLAREYYEKNIKK